MNAKLADWVRILGPVRIVFLASLLLSLIAAQGHLVNRDGVYYLEGAKAILEGGLAAGIRPGEWGFMPMLIAAISAVTRLDPETAALFMNALFMAGASALLVDWVKRKSPEVAWTACLVVLAMPAYNQYRGEILREYGFWFFCMLAFWLAMRWEETQRWREAVACQLALVAATLFRLEAVAFFAALILWQAIAAPRGLKLRRVLVIGALPLAGAALAVLLYGSGLLAMPQRVMYYLEAANPLHKLQNLNAAGARMVEAVFPDKYSREEAGYILLFGLLSIIPVKFLKMSGVLLIPMTYAFIAQPIRNALARWQPLPWMFLAHLFVLAAFVTHNFFLVGRYVSLLNMLAVPVVSMGLLLLMRRFPRLKAILAILVLITLLANVVSLSPRKTHIVEAGRWLAANVKERDLVCIANSRLAYYAGWRSEGIVFDGAQFEKQIEEGRCAWVAVEARKTDRLDAWLHERRLQEMRRFENRAGDAVVVARRDLPSAMR